VIKLGYVFHLFNTAYFTHTKDSRFKKLRSSYLFKAQSLEVEQKSSDIQEIKTFILQYCWDSAS